MSHLCDTCPCLSFGVLCLGRARCCAKAGFARVRLCLGPSSSSVAGNNRAAVQMSPRALLCNPPTFPLPTTQLRASSPARAQQGLGPRAQLALPSAQLRLVPPSPRLLHPPRQFPACRMLVMPLIAPRLREACSSCKLWELSFV